MVHKEGIPERASQILFCGGNSFWGSCNLCCGLLLVSEQESSGEGEVFWDIHFHRDRTGNAENEKESNVALSLVDIQK
jgi:hypothetical protein